MRIRCPPHMRAIARSLKRAAPLPYPIVTGGPNIAIASASCIALDPHCRIAIAAMAAACGHSPPLILCTAHCITSMLHPTCSTAMRKDCTSEAPRSKPKTVRLSSSSCRARSWNSLAAACEMPAVPLVVKRRRFRPPSFFREDRLRYIVQPPPWVQLASQGPGPSLLVIAAGLPRGGTYRRDQEPSAQGIGHPVDRD